MDTNANSDNKETLNMYNFTQVGLNPMVMPIPSSTIRPLYMITTYSPNRAVAVHTI